MKRKLSFMNLIPAFSILFAFIILSWATGAHASCESNVTFKSKATVTYKKNGFSSKPKPEVLEESRNKAIQDAFEQYADECLTKGQLKIYIRDKENFLGKAADLVNILYEKQNIKKEEREVQTLMKVSMKTKMLQALFEDNAPASKSGSTAYMVYIFAGRQAVDTSGGSEGGGSTKTFDANVTKIESSKTAATATEMSSQQGDTLTAAEQTEAMAKTQTGGSTVQKNAIVEGNNFTMGSRTYEMINTKGMDATFLEVMTGNGFRPVAYNSLVRACGCDNDPEVIKTELVETGDLSPDSWEMISMCLTENAKKRCNMPFIVVGTLDANTPMRSSVKAGMWQVQAKITGKVTDLRDFFPVDVASFSTRYEDGFDSADNAAREDAIKNLGTTTAQEITSQMNAAGIR